MCCVLENPVTQARELWIDGKCCAAISRGLLYEKDIPWRIFRVPFPLFWGGGFIAGRYWGNREGISDEYRGYATEISGQPKLNGTQWG